MSFTPKSSKMNSFWRWEARYWEKEVFAHLRRTDQQRSVNEIKAAIGLMLLQVPTVANKGKENKPNRSGIFQVRDFRRVEIKPSVTKKRKSEPYKVQKVETKCTAASLYRILLLKGINAAR